MELKNQQLSDTLEVLVREIRELKNLLGNSSEQFKIYSTEEVMSILGVSKKTLSNYRSNGKIGFSPEGNKLFYTKENIEEFLKARYRSPFNLKKSFN